MTKKRSLLVLALLSCLAVAASCSSADDAGDDAPRLSQGSTTPSTVTPGTDDEGGGDGADGPAYLVFNAQGNHLDAYDPAPPFEHQRVITAFADDPENGRDINGQICFFPDGSRRFIAGEDTGQNAGSTAGWGIFQLSGEGIGDFETRQVAKLTPTYPQATDNPEPYGCGILSDGRIVTTDVGNQALGDGTGQLTIWYPPFDGEQIAYCKLDTGIATAQSIWIDDQDRIHVASARPPTSGIWRYSGPYPTSADAAGGCGRTDATGAPLADEAMLRKELFIPAGENELISPTGVAGAPDGRIYVSSVFSGAINEYDENGLFLRAILRHPDGEAIGADTGFSTGTPLGIAVGADGVLYFADIGLRIGTDGLPGPGDGTGAVRRIVFEDGEPLPPETMAEGLLFPDAIGILDFGGGGGVSKA